MEERESKEVGKFALGIKIMEDANGSTSWTMSSRSEGISDETIIMLVKNWLRNMEDKYFESFKNKWSSISPK